MSGKYNSVKIIEIEKFEKLILWDILGIFVIISPSYIKFVCFLNILTNNEIFSKEIIDVTQEISKKIKTVSMNTVCARHAYVVYFLETNNYEKCNGNK